MLDCVLLRFELDSRECVGPFAKCLLSQECVVVHHDVPLKFLDVPNL